MHTIDKIQKSKNLILFSAGEKIAGILYQPESLQGMRENLERVLQFMASKKIRMHQISSREILEGNLKAVMRLILALAAHYKPQSVKHHDVSYDNIPDGKADTADKIEPHINGKYTLQVRSDSYQDLISIIITLSVISLHFLSTGPYQTLETCTEIKS